MIRKLAKYIYNIGLMIVDKINFYQATKKISNRVEVPNHYLGFIKPEKCPIILIHGYIGFWQKMGILGDHISLKGHPVHVLKKLGHNLINVPSSAQIVRNHLEKDNIKNAVIVAHSKGCLIGKYLMIHLNQDNRVIGMVAIAGPFNGTSIVKLLPMKSSKELDVDSDLVLDLHRHKEVNDKIISIFPKHDDSIWAENGSYLDGALDNIQLNIRGHNHPVFNEESKKVIVDCIERLSKKFYHQI